ncbi:50S ribosomal protein L19 [bacterium]|nr:50S ribosomal protein L19 [bacterium]
MTINLKHKLKQYQSLPERPEILPGDTVRVHQKVKEKDKERIQIFEGQVLAKKHGKEIGATVTVRSVIDGIGVEKIFPIYSPTIEKIEIIKRGKTKRAKLYYLRTAKGKKARLKRKEFKASSDSYAEVEELADSQA